MVASLVLAMEMISLSADSVDMLGLLNRKICRTLKYEMDQKKNINQEDIRAVD